MDIGLNLYSIRKQITTPEEYLSVARRLKDMGYTSLQQSGAPYDPEVLARVTRETGLPFVLTHMPAERILNETDALMAEHERFGCRSIGLGMMPLDALLDEALFFSTLDALERTAERMEAAGFRFFYHNHHYEFRRLSDGRTLFDHIVEDAPHVCFVPDTYWIQYGGADITETLEKIRGRMACVHLKDYKIERVEDTKKTAPVFAPVGDGNISFRTVVAKMRACGTEHFIVEQDNATDLPDPFGEVERSVRYIRAHLCG